jgi:hypothetical protein
MERPVTIGPPTLKGFVPLVVCRNDADTATGPGIHVAVHLDAWRIDPVHLSEVMAETVLARVLASYSVFCGFKWDIWGGHPASTPGAIVGSSPT